MDLYRDPALRSRLGENGRGFICKHYSRKQKALEYLRILENLSEKKEGRVTGGNGWKKRE
jgi:hypothetical protein